jgi:hypothetical protein
MAMALAIALAVVAPFGSVSAADAGVRSHAAERATLAGLATGSKVGSPRWWSGGTCDPTNDPGSYPLGASWHGLVACGPGPTQGGTDHLVNFFPGAWGEYQWECVELSMRWMYLAWGVNPYPADGWDVVANYDAGHNKAEFNPKGPDLVVVGNGTVGAVPQPGDVISVGRTQYNMYGHTAVVTANDVNAEGDGTITLIQQNGGAGNKGWVTYPVTDWVVGGGVTGWLHNPSWYYQWPLVGVSGRNGFAARNVTPGGSFSLASATATSIAVAGDAGATGSNGNAIYGYIGPNGEFFAKLDVSTVSHLDALHAASIAMARTASGAPVLGYVTPAGNFFAEQGSLGGKFTLQAQQVASIAIADGGGTAPPLLGYVQKGTGAFYVKSGVANSQWTLVVPSGVRSIALAEGVTASTGLLGYVSTNGTFYANNLSLEDPWTKEATRVSAISLASVGPNGIPLLGYLAANTFYAAEGLTPTTWDDEATGVTQMAVSSSSSPGGVPVLAYISSSSDLELLQGRISRPFSVQAFDVSSLALSTVNNS